MQPDAHDLVTVPRDKLTLLVQFVEEWVSDCPELAQETDVADAARDLRRALTPEGVDQ